MSVHTSPRVPLVLLVLVLVGITAAVCHSNRENGILLQLSDSFDQEDKVLMLSQMFQQALFADNNSQTILKMREVFFPSLKRRYWHTDNVEIIDIKICINFKKPVAVNDSPDAQCLVFRWTNSYFLNLVDIRQMNYFEFVSAGALFGVIAYGHHDREVKITFNLTHNESVSSIEDTITKKALVHFLSWVSKDVTLLVLIVCVYVVLRPCTGEQHQRSECCSPGVCYLHSLHTFSQSLLYARSQTVPSSWDETDQGYVTRKYDYTAVDLLLFDKQNYKAFFATLACFILCNAITMYLVMKYASSIHARFSKAASRNGYSSSIAKGLLVLAGVLVPTYIMASIVVYSTEPALSFTAQCTNTQKDRYGCIPEDEFPTVHQTQVLSLVSSFSSMLMGLVLYSLRSIYTVRNSVCSVFQCRCVKWIEVYLLWSAMVGIHIVSGLASIPLLIFTVLTPMYMIFYLSSITIGLAIVLLPIAAVFHLIQQVKKHRRRTIDTLLYIFNFIFAYLIGTGIVIMSIFLYFLFLDGGASMNGIKGVLYSLLPPAMISVVVFVFKRNATNKSIMQNDVGEKQPLLLNTITEHL